MALSKLDQLYRAVILEHSSNPRYRGTVENSNVQVELKNPVCGDVIQIQLLIEENVIKEACFDGYGCTISTASASMMTETIIGKTSEEAVELANEFSKVVQGQETKNKSALGDALMLSGVAKFPARIKCATLSWKALEKALAEKSHAAPEEHLRHDEI